MKRTKMKMNNKGFTLVELIVVLVILAILAAILVPTLLGYIERAKSEKDFSTAQTVRVAAQSEIAELYAKSSGDVTWPNLTSDDAKKAIFKLVGATDAGVLDGQQITFEAGKVENNQLTFLKITIGGRYYCYSSDTNEWIGGDAAKDKAVPQ